MRVQNLAQPPPRAPPDAAGPGRSGQTGAVNGIDPTARPPPVANDRGGGDWLDARLPTGTVAFWAQLIGQKMREQMPARAPPFEIMVYLDAYSQPQVQSRATDEDVLNPNLLDKPITVDLYT